MVGRRKKTKICDKVSEKEDRISQLPEPLISEILCHLSTKDAVRTSVLSTKWRNLWRWIPDLDLHSSSFSNYDAFVSFVEKFFSSHKESWIRKLRLSICNRYGICDFMSWINAATTQKIQHLDVRCYRVDVMFLSLCTCETLVQLRLCHVTLCNDGFVSLPCLKIMHLQHINYLHETTLQKLISGSPVLEDLMIIGPSKDDDDKKNVLQVRSDMIKRIYIDECIQFLIDAPLLQCLKATVFSPKNFEIVNLGFSAKLDIQFTFHHATYSSSMILDILTDISRFRELVISNDIWKEISLYSNSGPVLQFCDMSGLNELVKDRSMTCKKKKEPKVMFSTVPKCLVSSLKFVELRRSISGYEGEIELIRYLLKNSTILKKLRLNVYYPQNAKCAFLEEVVAMPRCSSACEVHCSSLGKRCWWS